MAGALGGLKGGPDVPGVAGWPRVAGNFDGAIGALSREQAAMLAAEKESVGAEVQALQKALQGSAQRRAQAELESRSRREFP